MKNEKKKKKKDCGPFKSKNISGFFEESSEITIRPTEPISPLKSMDSPSHSTRAWETTEGKHLALGC